MSPTTQYKQKIYEDLHDPAMAGQTGKQSTQQYLDIKEIRENTVVLKNGGMRSVLMTSNVNFALKSIEEQDAMVYGFQNFLNAMEFPLQIVIESRVLDIAPYLQMLKERERAQTNELLRLQTAAYRDYIGKLVKSTNIMKKNFYIVIPMSSGLAKADGGFLQTLMKAINPTKEIKQKQEAFHDMREKLTIRVQQVLEGISAMGLAARELNTKQLIELFFNVYNPERSFQGLGDLDQVELRMGTDTEEEQPAEEKKA